jgi:hypothetical protein
MWRRLVTTFSIGLSRNRTGTSNSGGQLGNALHLSGSRHPLGNSRSNLQEGTEPGHILLYVAEPGRQLLEHASGGHGAWSCIPHS